MSSNAARRRRQLLVASAPVVLMAALGSAKLISLNLVAGRTVDGFTTQDKVAVQTWAERQDFLNAIDPWRSQFALGDAAILNKNIESARGYFEQAFAAVPRGGLDESMVRVNLALTLEQIGDRDTANKKPDEAAESYAQAKKLADERPKVCDLPEGQGTGESLQDLQKRVEQKTANEDPPPSEPPPGTPTPTPSPNPSPDAQKQQELEQQRKEATARNLEQKNRSNGGGGTSGGTDPGDPGSGEPKIYVKPW